MKQKKHFPNGFTSWAETNYEVSSYIALRISEGFAEGSVIHEVDEKSGTGGLYELAQEWTDEFEKLHQGREWDGDYYEVVEEFLHTKNYPADKKTTEKKSVVDYSWEELHAFRFIMYPNDLILIAPISAEDVQDLWDEFSKMEDPGNFDVFVTERTGLPSMAALFYETPKLIL